MYNPFAQIDTLMVYSVLFCRIKEVEQSFTTCTSVDDDDDEIETLNWLSKLTLLQFQVAVKLKVFFWTRLFCTISMYEGNRSKMISKYIQ